MAFISIAASLVVIFLTTGAAGDECPLRKHVACPQKQFAFCPQRDSASSHFQRCATHAECPCPSICCDFPDGCETQCFLPDSINLYGYKYTKATGEVSNIQPRSDSIIPPEKKSASLPVNRYVSGWRFVNIPEVNDSFINRLSQADSEDDDKVYFPFQTTLEPKWTNVPAKNADRTVSQTTPSPPPVLQSSSFNPSNVNRMKHPEPEWTHLPTENAIRTVSQTTPSPPPILQSSSFNPRNAIEIKPPEPEWMHLNADRTVSQTTPSTPPVLQMRSFDTSNANQQKPLEAESQLKLSGFNNYQKKTQPDPHNHNLPLDASGTAPTSTVAYTTVRSIPTSHPTFTTPHNTQKPFFFTSAPTIFTPLIKDHSTATATLTVAYTTPIPIFHPSISVPQTTTQQQIHSTLAPMLFTTAGYVTVPTSSINSFTSRLITPDLTNELQGTENGNSLVNNQPNDPKPITLPQNSKDLHNASPIKVIDNLLDILPKSASQLNSRNRFTENKDKKSDIVDLKYFPQPTTANMQTEISKQSIATNSPQSGETASLICPFASTKVSSPITPTTVTTQSLIHQTLPASNTTSSPRPSTNEIQGTEVPPVQLRSGSGSDMPVDTKDFGVLNEKFEPTLQPLPITTILVPATNIPSQIHSSEIRTQNYEPLGLMAKLVSYKNAMTMPGQESTTTYAPTIPTITTNSPTESPSATASPFCPMVSATNEFIIDQTLPAPNTTRSRNQSIGEIQGTDDSHVQLRSGSGTDMSIDTKDFRDPSEKLGLMIITTTIIPAKDIPIQINISEASTENYNQSHGLMAKSATHNIAITIASNESTSKYAPNTQDLQHDVSNITVNITQNSLTESTEPPIVEIDRPVGKDDSEADETGLFPILARSGTGSSGPMDTSNIYDAPEEISGSGNNDVVASNNFLNGLEKVFEGSSLIQSPFARSSIQSKENSESTSLDGKKFKIESFKEDVNQRIRAVRGNETIDIETVRKNIAKTYGGELKNDTFFFKKSVSKVLKPAMEVEKESLIYEYQRPIATGLEQNTTGVKQHGNVKDDQTKARSAGFTSKVSDHIASENKKIIGIKETTENITTPVTESIAIMGALARSSGISNKESDHVGPVNVDTKSMEMKESNQSQILDPTISPTTESISSDTVLAGSDGFLNTKSIGITESVENSTLFPTASSVIENTTKMSVLARSERFSNNESDSVPVSSENKNKKEITETDPLLGRSADSSSDESKSENSTTPVLLSNQNSTSNSEESTKSNQTSSLSVKEPFNDKITEDVTGETAKASNNSDINLNGKPMTRSAFSNNSEAPLDEKKSNIVQENKNITENDNPTNISNLTSSIQLDSQKSITAENEPGSSMINESGKDGVTLLPRKEDFNENKTENMDGQKEINENVTVKDSLSNFTETAGNDTENDTTTEIRNNSTLEGAPNITARSEPKENDKVITLKGEALALNATETAETENITSNLVKRSHGSDVPSDIIVNTTGISENRTLPQIGARNAEAGKEPKNTIKSENNTTDPHENITSATDTPGNNTSNTNSSDSGSQYRMPYAATEKVLQPTDGSVDMPTQEITTTAGKTNAALVETTLAKTAS